jgi:hypothetical protein
MKKLARACLLAVLACAASGAWAEAGIVVYGSTGLPVEGLQGWLGSGHERDRIVVRTDETPVYIIFFWDSRDLVPDVAVTDATGSRVGEFDLTRGNRVTLSRPGEFVCTITARKGSGHWYCVVLSGRTWDD